MKSLCSRVALLVFHRALFDHPSDPSVVAAFCLAVNNGGDLSEASDIAKRITRRHDTNFVELLEPQDLDFDSLVAEVKHLAALVQDTLANMTDEYSVSRAMAQYPKAPYSDIVSSKSSFFSLKHMMSVFFAEWKLVYEFHVGLNGDLGVLDASLKSIL